MSSTHIAIEIPDVMTGREFEQKSRAVHRRTWSWKSLCGRVIELRDCGASAVLSFSFALVHEAQMAREPVAWISATQSLFYAPDVLENGIDLEALAIVRLHDARQAARAADKLVSSGAFGLVVVDLGEEAWFPRPLQNRLAHHAHEHETAVVCLTKENATNRDESDLNFTSMRAEARIEKRHEDFVCTLNVRRDKKHGPGWTVEEASRGPIGMR